MDLLVVTIRGKTGQIRTHFHTKIHTHKKYIKGKPETQKDKKRCQGEKEKRGGKKEPKERKRKGEKKKETGGGMGLGG